MILLLNNHHLIVKVYWTLDGQEVYFVGILPKTHHSNESDQDYVVKMRKPRRKSHVIHRLINANNSLGFAK